MSIKTEIQKEIVDAYLAGVTVVSKDEDEILKSHLGTYVDYKEFARLNYEDYKWEAVPSFIYRHINLESMGRELAQDYLAVEYNGQLFVFNY